LRDEFEAVIDAHPDGVGNEAGVLNRASRAAAGVILGTPSGPADVPTWTLRWVALLRLAEAGG
jgi:hypothetical protein